MRFRCTPICMVIASVCLASDLHAATISTVAAFQSENRLSYAGLVRDATGNLYGTSMYGGQFDRGTVFKVTPGGSVSTLHSFTTENRTGPDSGLIIDPAGNLFGVTSNGGTNGYGSLYKVTPTGTYSTIASFTYANGRLPSGELHTDAAGNFYGVTIAGGPTSDGQLFKVTPSGTITTLASFREKTYGAGPKGKLLADASGNLYGTTTMGGTGQYSGGVVYKLTPGGALSVVANLGTANLDGPQAGLVADKSGNLYGTTLSAGVGTSGSVFKVTPDGTVSTLVKFTGANGASPYAGLITDAKGDLFGTTSTGGAFGHGTVFKVTQTGQFTTLASFGNVGGYNTWGTLIADDQGNLYGTTYGGSTGYDFGTVFKVSDTGFAVPEPATMVALAGAAMIAVRRRREFQ